MSIDNLLTAMDQAEDGAEASAIIFRHLTPENGFHVRGVPAHSGVSPGLFAIDLNASSVDTIYVHADGYVRLRSVEEVVEFLCCFIPREELEKALRGLGYERVPQS